LTIDFDWPVMLIAAATKTTAISLKEIQKLLFCENIFFLATVRKQQHAASVCSFCIIKRKCVGK